MKKGQEGLPFRVLSKQMRKKPALYKGKEYSKILREKNGWFLFAFVTIKPPKAEYFIHTCVIALKWNSVELLRIFCLIVNLVLI